MLFDDEPVEEEKEDEETERLRDEVTERRSD
jgi:hypothetical protein